MDLTIGRLETWKNDWEYIHVMDLKASHVISYSKNILGWDN